MSAMEPPITTGPDVCAGGVTGLVAVEGSRANSGIKADEDEDQDEDEDEDEDEEEDEDDVRGIED